MMVSAFEPVKNSQGDVVGVIAVDLQADQVNSSSIGFMLRLLLVVAVFCPLACIVVYRLIIRVVGRPIRTLTEASEQLALGDSSVEVQSLLGEGEIGKLAASFTSMIESTRRQVEVLQALAAGDLRSEVIPRSDRDIMSHAIRQTIEQLNDIFGGLLQHTSQVSYGAQQIATGAQLLASGSTEQAASVEELSASVANIRTIP